MRASKRILGLMALAMFLVLGASAAGGRAGDLDQTFGSGGKVVVHLGPAGDDARAVVVQPDGKIVVAGRADQTDGTTGSFGLARFNRDGTLDTTFGPGGTVRTPFGQDGEIQALALQKDDKIVAAGTTTSGGSAFALARYRSNGSLDISFGDGGLVTTGFTWGEAHGVVIQPDGKIVVAGRTLGKFALARYRPDGSLDASFGSGGRVVSIEGQMGATSLVRQPDGKLIAAGGLYFDSRWQFGLVRFNTDGSLDGTFGSDGIASAAVGDVWAQPNAMALQSDGKIVAAGVGEDTNGNLEWGAARWDRDGTLDQTFGQNGVVVTEKANWAAAVAVQPNGKIVTAGDTYPRADASLVTLVRYGRNGALDRSFGNRGIVTTTYADDPLNYGSALALQPDGKILVAGNSSGLPLTSIQVGVVRLVGDGTCVVPNVRRKPLASAKRALTRAGCSPGRVSRRFSTSVKKGRIVSQRPGAGASLAASARVDLVVSKGKRRR